MSLRTAVPDDEGHESRQRVAAIEELLENASDDHRRPRTNAEGFAGS